MRFNVVDDFHRPDFGSPRDRTCGQACFESIEGIDAITQLPLHFTADVHHMTVTLHHHDFGQFDASKLCHAANIVSAQINKHDVFRTLFRIRQQFFL